MRAFRAVARPGKVVGSCSWAHPHHPRRINTSITQQPKDDSRCIGGNSRNRRQLFVKKIQDSEPDPRTQLGSGLSKLICFVFRICMRNPVFSFQTSLSWSTLFTNHPKNYLNTIGKKAFIMVQIMCDHCIVKAASTSDKTHPFSLTLA